MDRFEILAESWNAPVIITSMVQLLQTFFSGKTACIRRFQALCNSVVVIDEVQTVPGNMLSLFNLMINYLSEICGVTFILCSATQPYFEGAEHPLLSTPTEIVPYSEELWKPFRRTRLIEVPGMKLEDMPEFILREAAETKSLLVICNKKTEAEYLVRKIEESGKQCFHLSASMCMAHRKKVLQEIMDAIRIIAPLLVLVLSVIEYISAVTSKSADGLKKANGRLVKRLILMVVLFILPSFINVILGFFLGPEYNTCVDLD